MVEETSGKREGESDNEYYRRVLRESQAVSASCREHLSKQEEFNRTIAETKRKCEEVDAAFDKFKKDMGDIMKKLTQNIADQLAAAQTGRLVLKPGLRHSPEQVSAEEAG